MKILKLIRKRGLIYFKIVNQLKCIEMIKFNNHREDNGKRLDNDETSSKEDISLIDSHFQCFQDQIKEFSEKYKILHAWIEPSY